jgi:energy-coupling factor transporter ATP-binding protein EcfA2
MFPNRYAYLLGVQAYQDTKIPKLSTPVNDINRLKPVLETYQFTVTTLPDPTEEQFRRVFDEDLPKLPADAQVIVYYAGHGMPATNPDGDQPDTEQGYLLPVDVKSTNKDVPEKAIPMSFLAASLSALPFPQLLLILDCCYAGMFQQALTMYSPRSVPALSATGAKAIPAMVSTLPEASEPLVADRSIKGSRTSSLITQEEFTSFTGYKARQIFTSTAFDQKAKDSYAGIALANGNSPFADKLCDALGSDRETVDNNNGIVTLFELQTYMQPRLNEYKQLCCIFPFAGDNGGEFVFLNPDSDRLILSEDKRRNPFMGLMDYESKDARYYFGRRAVIDELLPIIRKEKFVVVVGASGSGKSSLIKAGILPQLESDPHQVIQPGTKPMDNLAALTVTKDRFLVIDQMEELITQAHALDKGTMLTDFFGAVFTLIDTGQVTGVIGTLRIEFIKPLKAAVESIRPGFWKQYLVPTFSIEDLTDIILRPAELVKVFFQPQRAVVGKIINDFRLYPNALPLLSLALEDLFASTFRADHTIRFDDYKGIEAVLKKKEDVLKGIKTDDLGLQPDQIDEFRRNLLIRFVSYQQGTYVRRRIPYTSEQKGELVFGAAYNTLTNRLLEALEANRLIETIRPPDTDGSKPEAGQKAGYVEMAHEALIFSWDEFRSMLLTLGSDMLIHRTELAQAATHYDPQEPMTWSNQQMLDLFGKFERPNWANQWPIRRVYQPGWGYFWPFKTFDRLFGSFIWLTVAERNFLETSYKASRRRRISVLAGLATIFILFWSFLFYLRDIELRQQQKDLVERAKDGIAQNLTTANMLAFNNAYKEALNQYKDVKDSLEQAEWVKLSSLDEYRTKEQSKVKATIDSTRQRQKAYMAVVQVLRDADSLSQWPLQNVSQEMAESCQRYTYFTRAADKYRQADASLDKNERWFRRGVFKQTWDALHQQTLRGLTLTTIQLGNLQKACLDVSVGFDLVSTVGRDYRTQRNQYKTISQSIAVYLAKAKAKPHAPPTGKKPG